MHGFKAGYCRYPDPGYWRDGELPTPTRIPTRTRNNEDRWQEVISLLIRGLHEGGEARERAAIRLSYLMHQKRLKRVEKSQIAQALWNATYTDSDGLPSDSALHDWAILHLPEPKLGTAERHFRQKWLTPPALPEGSPPAPEDVFWQVGKAIAAGKTRQKPFSLSKAEQSHLLEVITHWLDTPIPSHAMLHRGPYFESHYRQPVIQAVNGLRSIVTEIQISQDLAVRLLEKVRVLNDSNFPGFILTAGLVKALPDRVPELAISTRIGLASEDEDVAEYAVIGLLDWLMKSAADSSQVIPPPDDLIREIGIIIATRRKASLEISLEVANWIFDKGNDKHQEVIHDLVLQGLDHLAKDLNYAENDSSNVPSLRHSCIRLALTLAEHGSKTCPAVARWLEIAKTDPLPEVRYARHVDLS